MLGSVRNEVAPVIGREQEQRLLTSVLDEVAARGQALVLRGEADIGKSRLISDTARAARERGMATLTTTGVQTEAHLPFAGLHQMLGPVRARAARLPSAQQAALDAAFGLTDEVAPEHYRIAMAALDLVSEVAADAPLLLVAEDAQWLDRPSLEVPRSLRGVSSPTRSCCWRRLATAIGRCWTMPAYRSSGWVAWAAGQRERCSTPALPSFRWRHAPRAAPGDAPAVRHEHNASPQRSGSGGAVTCSPREAGRSFRWARFASRCERRSLR